MFSLCHSEEQRDEESKKPWGVAPTPHKPLKRLEPNFSQKPILSFMSEKRPTMKKSAKGGFRKPKRTK